MRKNYLFILFAILMVEPIVTKAQTNKNYELIRFEGSYNMKEVHNILISNEINDYRKLNERVLIKIVDGPLAELYSHSELLSSNSNKANTSNEIIEIKIDKNNNFNKSTSNCISQFAITIDTSIAGTVQACFTILPDGWSRLNSNWVHGVIPSIGAGLTNMQSDVIPASQDGSGV